LKLVSIIDRQDVELGGHRMPAEMTDRRFPPPWTLDEHDECFIVRDAACAL
jgi:hypothetical protein